MTRNAFHSLYTVVAAAFILQLPFPLHCFATVDSPTVQSLGGAGRAGLPREALYSNPAAVAQINDSFGFIHYSLPKIADFNAGGRAYNVGLYDGGNAKWKGGFGYSRVSKAVIQQGQQGYRDYSEFRFATAHAVTQNIVAGLQTRYAKTHSNPESSRFFEGTLGAMFPLFSDIRGGVTWENVLGKEDSLPSTIGVGALYSFGFGIIAYADGYRLMGGTRKGERGWALGGQLGLTGDFSVRAGLFEEAYRYMKGWSLGLSWAGPRASFDYALRTAGSGPKEKEHIFGMTLAL